jgi:hypothetical protein
MPAKPNPLLERIKRGAALTAFRVMLTGPEGIGKSTWASNAPKPLFIAPEDGLTGLERVQRFIPTSLDDLHQLLDSLILDIADFGAIVIDTTDWLERLISQSMCKRDGKDNIEEYGYGKGYVILENELVKLLQKLDTIRANHKIWIVLLAHVQIRTFNDPRGMSYDRYEMKGNKKFTGVLREWPDACLFAVFDVVKTKLKDKDIDQAVAGERTVHTIWSPAWDAKNRLNLPEEIPLDWSEFERVIRESSAPVLIESFKAAYKAATKIPPEDKPKWEKAVSLLTTYTPDKLRAGIKKLESLK